MSRGMGKVQQKIMHRLWVGDPCWWHYRYEDPEVRAEGWIPIYWVHYWTHLGKGYHQRERSCIDSTMRAIRGLEKKGWVQSKFDYNRSRWSLPGRPKKKWIRLAPHIRDKTTLTSEAIDQERT